MRYSEQHLTTTFKYNIMTKQEMNNILQDIDNTINNSKYSYKEYADKMGYSLKNVSIETEEDPFKLDDFELEQSNYNPLATVVSEEFFPGSVDSFRIGNNKSGGNF